MTNLQLFWKQSIDRLKIFSIAVILLLGLNLRLSLPALAATTEAEVLQVIRNHPEVILESLQAYEVKQREQQTKAKQQIATNIQKTPNLFIQGSPTTGSAKQKILLVEFSDFQCPYCAAAHQTVKEFMKTHQDKVTLVYKHFPLTEIHPEATPAAKASWAADRQGKFWQYHDALFTQQDKLGEQTYIDIAKKLNLNIEKFNRDRQQLEAERAIGQDIELANKLGVQGTPFFVINSRIFEGVVPVSVLENAVSTIDR